MWKKQVWLEFCIAIRCGNKAIWNMYPYLLSCGREVIFMGEKKSGALNRATGQALCPGRLVVKWWGLSAKYTNLTSSPLQEKAKYLQACKMIRLVWVLAIAGLIVSGTVFHFFSREHYKHFEDMLVNMCDERARMLQHQFAVSMNHVHSLAILVSTFYVGKQPRALDQATFAEYTARTAFERPLMTGVAYAQKVLHTERESFEREQGWSIKTMHSKDLIPVKEEYAPTVFAQETIGYLVSLDMMSGDEDQENILRARATGKGVLTRPFRLLESNHLGVVLTFAVYKKDLPLHATPQERIQAAAGYLGGAFDFESLVETLLRQLAKNEAIIVNVYDVTNSSNPLVMYGPDPPGRPFSHLSPLDFGDPFRKHEMRCRLARKVPYPKLALGFASGVLALVTLICYMVYNAHMHVKKVEEDYRKMEELKVQAEAADIAKSQFLATVSHEIRTPMNGVLGMLKMLMDTQLDAMQQDFARTAHASGKALITLINEVLDQAKIESGRIELEAVPFDIRAILDDVLSLFSGKARNEGIELAVFVSERVPQILIGDPGRFRQIATNLVGNSVKFTSKGHIFVCVHIWDDIEPMQASAGREVFSKECREASSCARDNGILSPLPLDTLSGSPVVNGWSSWETFKCLLSGGIATKTETLDPNAPLELLSDVKLFLSIEDTGVGIPLQAQKRIFMPFMQADSSTSRTYGGTGIGLSISKCLVELMNGEMGFKSCENVGSTFTCTLVLKKGRSDSLEDSKRSDPLPTEFKGMRALIVDGRPVRAEVSRYHLVRLGLKVQLVYDCKQALQMLSGGGDNHSSGEESLDMVLVDKDAWGPRTGLTFPHLLKEARRKQGSLASWRPSKTILLATSIDNVESDQAKAMGYVDTVIVKPLRASMIAACLQQALGMGNKGHHHHHQGQGGLPEEPTNLRSLLWGKQILVVDDNKVNLRVAAGALKKYGAHVKCADSGKDAIKMLKQPHKFDACFMDIQMPEMDGFEATRHIRENEKGECCKGSENIENGCRHKRVPILAMTADVIQATHEQCMRCGMDGYVSKPFEEDELYRSVTRFFDSHK